MKKYFIISFFIILFIILICSIAYGFQNLESNYIIGTVNASSLNLRTGTDTSFESLCKLQKGDSVKVFNKIGEWYIVQNSNNQIGVANSKYITLDYTSQVTSNDFEDENLNELSVDENKLFNLINEKRNEVNLPPLIIDNDLQNLARLKARDLVSNNCFSHISPSYGSPFDMLRNNSISYKTASENIAGNKDIEKAVESWINSDAHKKNILSSDYNYTGIGVVDSISYGKIIVELFIGR